MLMYHADLAADMNAEQLTFPWSDNVGIPHEFYSAFPGIPEEGAKGKHPRATTGG